MITAKKTGFDEIIGRFEGAPRLHSRLSEVGKSVRERTSEIRVRVGQPITLELGTTRLVLGGTEATAEEICELLNAFCGYSLYACQNELARGFITIDGGHRVGICGTAVTDNGIVSTQKHITSLNIRVARERKGCADELYERVFRNEEVGGLLIIGKPLSGKTTVLRDLARILAEESKVAVIDERGEIAAASGGKINNDLGRNCDILNGFGKSEGIITAVRSLSPDYIICDEIGGFEKEIVDCLFSGVRVILTAHCRDFEEAERSPIITNVLKSGGVSHIALLGSGSGIGRLIGVRRVRTGGEPRGGNSSDNLGRSRDGGGAVFFEEA